MPAAFEQLPNGKAHAITQAGTAEFSVCAYTDANTDRITAACGISKGLLYHYFGTKKQFYLHCLKNALDTLTNVDTELPKGEFYAILFASMENKMRQCSEHPAETKLLNMAAREFSREVKSEKDALFVHYAAQLREASAKTLDAALAALALKPSAKSMAAQGLTLYSEALMNRYLLLYQDAPEKFFSDRETIAGELKSYIDMMLYGICEEEQ